MAIKKKSSKVLSLILAVIMMLSIVPASIFAADALDELRDGKVAISSDMTDDQVKKVLFDNLVNDPDGKNYQDYEWEYACKGKWAALWTPDARWGNALTGFSTKVALTDYWHPAVKDNTAGNYQIRIAGKTEEATLTLVKDCTLTVDYDVTKGDVLANGNVVTGTNGGFSPKSSVVLTVNPKDGYVVESVKVNGAAIEANEEGVYEFVPVAETTVEVAFAEAGTFHDIILPEVAGVSYKVNGFDAKGSFRVNADVDTVIEYITDSSTSIDKITMNGADVTETVAFANYNGTQTLKVTEDTEIAVETVKSAIALTGETVIPVIADANGNWDYTQIRQAVIDTLISADSTIGDFDPAKVDVTYDANTVADDSVKAFKPLDFEYAGAAWEQTFWWHAKNRSDIEIRLAYKGDGQYRPTEYVYQRITVKDLEGAKIAVRTGVQTFTLNQLNDGSFDYESLRKAIYKAVIDEANSTPAGAVSYDKVSITYLLLDDINGDFGDAGEFYPFEKEPSGWDSGNTFKYLYKGGTFTIRVSLPSTESYYGTSVEFDVKVETNKLPTAEISVKENAPASLTLNRNFDRTYDYAALKQDIFEQVLEIKNLPEGTELTADDITFVRYASGWCTVTGSWMDTEPRWVPFEGMTHPTMAGGYYQEISAAGEGEYEIRATLPTGEGYYGSELTFKININFVDDHTSQIEINDGPFEFTLNENGIGTYDYEGLKQEIYNAVIKNVKNVSADLAWDDFDYTYKLVDGIGGSFGSAGGFAPFEQTKDGWDVTGTFKYLYKGGNFTMKIALADGEDYYGSEVTFDVKVNIQGLPKVELSTTAQETTTLVLERNKNRTYDYDSLRADVLALIDVKNLPDGETVSIDNFVIERKANGTVDGNGTWNALGKSAYVAFEGQRLDAISRYQAIHEAGEGVYEMKVTLKDCDAYYGSAVEFKVTVVFNDEFTTKIALKQDYDQNFTLYYKSADEFDYDRLKKDIFDTVVDTANSSDNVTFENAQFTYKLVDGIGGSFGSAGGFAPFEQTKDGWDTGNTFRYLHKGGNFDIKIFIPDGELFSNSVIVNVNVGVFGRENSYISLTDGVSMDYNKDVNAVKQYVFDNVIAKVSSYDPNATIDDFKFEYYTSNTTAGGLTGVEKWWVPFEGMDHPTLAGSYFKRIGGGTWKIRVTYTGSTEYNPATSNEVSFTLTKADVNVSLSQNYVIVGNEIDASTLKTDPVDTFSKYFFTLRLNSISDDSEGVINIQSNYGIAETDLTVKPTFLFQEVLDRSALDVYTKGLSREELIKLVNSTQFADYLSNYNMDASVVEALKNVVKESPATMQKFCIYAGSPKTPGTYKAVVAAAHEQYNTGVLTTDYYVKYNTKGWKLNWVSDTSGLNTRKAADFDFRAVVTKDGVPQESGHVKYIYTGFRSNFLIYASTTEPPREAGIYTQTAWTGIKGHYAFPKTRTFTISKSIL